MRTAYVEHDIQGSDVEMSVVDFVFADPNMLGASKEEISNVLGSIGFTEEMKNAPINSLSGGWRMKLALARAMIMKADIMLLDEPTNHLVSEDSCCAAALLLSACSSGRDCNLPVVSLAAAAAPALLGGSMPAAHTHTGTATHWQLSGAV